MTAGEFQARNLNSLEPVQVILVIENNMLHGSRMNSPENQLETPLENRSVRFSDELINTGTPLNHEDTINWNSESATGILKKKSGPRIIGKTRKTQGDVASGNATSRSTFA